MSLSLVHMAPEDSAGRQASLRGWNLVLITRAFLAGLPGQEVISPSLEVSKQRLRGLGVGILILGVRLAPPLRFFLL